MNKKYTTIITICICSLFCACSSDYYYTKQIRESVKKNAEAVKLDARLLQYELQSVDYQMDSCERLLGTITDSFTIANIYEGKGVFEIVLLSKYNRYYEAYSPKIECSRGIKIKEGHSYKMTIVPYFKIKTRRPIEIVRPVYFKGFRILPYSLYHGQVYSIENLEGLHLLTDGM